MQQKQRQRINRISKQLNKLNNLIEYSKNESIEAFKILQNCHNISNSSSDDRQIEQNNDFSYLLDENDSRDTIQTIQIQNNNNIIDEFYQNKSLEMINKQIQYNNNNNNKNKNNINNNNRQIDHSYHQQDKYNFDLHKSNLSSKQSGIEVQISEIKPIDTTIKKSKLQKGTMKNKKNNFEKQRVLSRNGNDEKIGRIKSENKMMSAHPMNFKRGINMIREQMSVKKERMKKQGKEEELQRNYVSNKIEKLNSKRNLKYNSVNKIDKEKLEKLEKHSKSKFHLNLQKQVTMKITDLKIKKNLCQIETSYLSASVKITKEQISKIDDVSSQYSDETLLKYFILKSIIKFISQYNDETWTNSQDIEINNQMVMRTLKKPEKFIKIINKLPDILRRRNIVSEFICKQFIEEKSFIEQKLNNLSSSKVFPKQPLYVYLCQLHSYIEFLLNNSMIHETKRNKIFNPTSEEFFSDRSAKQMKLTVNVPKQSKFESKKKDFSERKKPVTATLKRVNTSKALKKSVTANNSSKLKRT